MKTRHAVWISVLAALLVYGQAYRNGWALDDERIVATNPRVESVGSALRAFFEPYWPPLEGAEAGQYRPITILSYGIDHQLAGDSAAWAHVVNVILHAAVTALVVLVALSWTTPLGALVAGLVFAVHPVHVEAVANVVGRAELLVACGLLAAVLAARRFRRAETRMARRGWLAVVVVAVVMAQLSKEHGVVAVAVIALDEALDPRRNFKASANLYLAVIAATLAWLYLWSGIAGEYVERAGSQVVDRLSLAERLSVVLPVQLHVVRLLAWPFDLAADYHPQVIPRLTEWSWLATLGLTVVTSILVLAVAVRRRAPEVTFGVLCGVITYSPTSNLVVTSGVMLAERTLYLAAIATAFSAGWLVVNLRTGKRLGTIVTVALGVVVAAYAAKTVVRVPFWRDTQTVVIDDFSEHSENYRTRLRVGRMLLDSGDLPSALAEAMAAGAIYPDDPYVALFTVYRAISLGLPDIAVREALRSHALAPEDPAVGRLVVRAYLSVGEPDSAVAYARRGLDEAPESLILARIYIEALDSLRAPAWQRWFAEARYFRLDHRLSSASVALDSAMISLPSELDDSRSCWDLTSGLRDLEDLRPTLLPQAQAVRHRSALCGSP